MNQSARWARVLTLAGLAQRYDGQRTKAETDAAKIIVEINREMVRLTADQQRLDKALEREQLNEARKLKAEQARLQRKSLQEAQAQ
ncbi:hypothetical protein [Pseudomonas lundensis]|uniref:hypothetical protein n=1 Tax=Pseudomonas lundensis TaxID=86185 RepID=UPI001475BC6D|nr:hypothetical protein [Pseudomonas lundensis]NNA01294.1 hypothetical protein [Pseudomonas lundensis]